MTGLSTVGCHLLSIFLDLLGRGIGVIPHNTVHFLKFGEDDLLPVSSIFRIEDKQHSLTITWEIKLRK